MRFLLSNKKIPTLALSVIYTSVNVVFVHSAESRFWADRRKARASGDWMARLPDPVRLGSSLPRVAPLNTAVAQNVRADRLPQRLDAAHRTWLTALPASRVSLRRVTLPTGTPRGLVIHLQDVHHNPEAQRNLGDALAAVLSAAGGHTPVVGLEGAFGPIRLDHPRAFPDRDALRTASEEMLRQNEISGPVHALLNAAGPMPILVGIDDPDHYKANADAYRRAHPGLPAEKERLARARAALDTAKAAAYSPALLAFDQKTRAYQRGESRLGDLARILDPRPSKEYPALVGFLETLEMEESLNDARVEAERGRLLESLTRSLPAPALERLAASAIAYRAGEMTAADFYTMLSGLCRAAAVDLEKTPAFAAYLRYVLRAQHIDADRLFDELRARERAVYESLLSTSEERRLWEESLRLGLEEKLADFSLSPEEWVALQRYGPARSPVLAEGARFYAEAHARDAAMTDRLLLAMTDRPGAVLVTGGYHARGMTDRLVRAGYAVAAAVPKLSRVDGPQGAEYLSLFAREKTPLDKLFEGPSLFLAASPASDQSLARTVLTAGAVSVEKSPEGELPGPVREHLGRKFTVIDGGRKNGVGTVRVRRNGRTIAASYDPTRPGGQRARWGLIGRARLSAADLRRRVGRLTAGVRRLFRGARGAPAAVEILDVGARRRLDVRAVFIDFDLTIWAGYPFEAQAGFFVDRLFAGDPAKRDPMTRLLKRVSGLSESEKIAAFRADRALGFPSLDAAAWTAVYRDVRARVKDHIENQFDPRLVPGVRDFLREVRATGRPIYVLTGGNAAECRARAERLGVAAFIDGYYGDGNKAARIAALLKEKALAPAAAVMIGDAPSDMEAARINGVLGVGLALDSADERSLASAGAGVLVRRAFPDPGLLLRALNMDVPSALFPARAGLRTSVGTYAPLFQIRSEQDWGIGDFGTALEVVDLHKALGLTLLQIEPLNLSSAGNSPYSVASSRAIEPNRVDVEAAVALWAPDGVTAAWIAAPDTRQRIAALRASPRVRYGDVDALKREALGRLWTEVRSDPRLRAAILDFRRDNADWLDDHLLYVVLKRHFLAGSGVDEKGRPLWDWRNWPADLRDRDGAALRRARLQHREALAFETFVQFLAANQRRRFVDGARRRGVEIMVDIPFALDGADLWIHPEVFGLKRAEGYRRSVTQGVPPEPAYPAGQYWQFFPFDWTRAASVRFIEDLLRFNQQWATCVRLDHVLGYYRAYLFSEDGDGRLTLENLGLTRALRDLQEKGRAGGDDAKRDAVAAAARLLKEKFQYLAGRPASDNPLPSPLRTALFAPGGDWAPEAALIAARPGEGPSPRGGWGRQYVVEQAVFTGRPHWDFLRLTPRSDGGDGGFLWDYLFGPGGDVRADDSLRPAAFVRAPGEDVLSRLLAVAQEKGTQLVWETLGTVPAGVPESVRRLGGTDYIPVIYGENPNSLYHPSHHVPNAYVTLGLHDSTTLRHRWEYEWSDGDRRHLWGLMRPGRAPPADLHAFTPEIRDGLISLVMRSPARIAALTWTDLLGLGEEHRINAPGVQDGQWTGRWPYTVEEMARALAAGDTTHPAYDALHALPRLMADGGRHRADPAPGLLRTDPETDGAMVQLRPVGQPFLIDAFVHRAAAVPRIRISDAAGDTVAAFPLERIGDAGAGVGGTPVGVSQWRGAWAARHAGDYTFTIESNGQTSPLGRLRAVPPDTDLNPLSPDYGKSKGLRVLPWARRAGATLIGLVLLLGTVFPSFGREDRIFTERGWSVLGAVDSGPAAQVIRTPAGAFTELKIMSGGDQVGSVKGNGYYRVTPAGTVWGTSFVTPGYWTGGRYHHNAAITDLAVTIDTAGRLVMKGKLEAPHLTADDFTLTFDRGNPREKVELNVSFTLKAKTDFSLDAARGLGGEALKIAQFSSMNIGSDWDADVVSVGGKTARLNVSDALVFDRPVPVLPGQEAALTNDSDRRPRRTPTTYLRLGPSMGGFVTQGWVTRSRDPNDDNVGVWLGWDGRGKSRFLRGETIGNRVEFTAGARAPKGDLSAITAPAPGPAAVDEVAYRRAQGDEESMKAFLRAFFAARGYVAREDGILSGIAIFYAAPRAANRPYSDFLNEFNPAKLEAMEKSGALRRRSAGGSWISPDWEWRGLPLGRWYALYVAGALEGAGLLYAVSRLGAAAGDVLIPGIPVTAWLDVATAFGTGGLAWVLFRYLHWPFHRDALRNASVARLGVVVFLAGVFAGIPLVDPGAGGPLFYVLLVLVSAHHYVENADALGGVSPAGRWASRWLKTAPPSPLVLSLGANGIDETNFLVSRPDAWLRGITVSRQDLARAEERARSSGVSGRAFYALQDMRNGLPAEDATVRLVYARLSLHYLDRTEAARVLGEVRRVLAPGGRAVIVVKSENDFWARHASARRDPESGMTTYLERPDAESLPLRRRFYSEAALRESLTAAGLAPEGKIRRSREVLYDDPHASDLLTVVVRDAALGKTATARVDTDGWVGRLRSKLRTVQENPVFSVLVASLALGALPAWFGVFVGAESPGGWAVVLSSALLTSGVWFLAEALGSAYQVWRGRRLYGMATDTLSRARARGVPGSDVVQIIERATSARAMHTALKERGLFGDAPFRERAFQAAAIELWDALRDSISVQAEEESPIARGLGFQSRRVRLPSGAWVHVVGVSHGMPGAGREDLDSAGMRTLFSHCAENDIPLLYEKNFFTHSPLRSMEGAREVQDHSGFMDTSALVKTPVSVLWLNLQSLFGRRSSSQSMDVRDFPPDTLWPGGLAMPRRNRLLAAAAVTAADASAQVVLVVGLAHMRDVARRLADRPAMESTRPNQSPLFRFDLDRARDIDQKLTRRSHGISWVAGMPFEGALQTRLRAYIETAAALIGGAVDSYAGHTHITLANFLMKGEAPVTADEVAGLAGSPLAPSLASPSEGRVRFERVRVNPDGFVVLEGALTGPLVDTREKLKDLGYFMYGPNIVHVALFHIPADTLRALSPETTQRLLSWAGDETQRLQREPLVYDLNTAGFVFFQTYGGADPLARSDPPLPLSEGMDAAKELQRLFVRAEAARTRRAESIEPLREWAAAMPTGWGSWQILSVGEDAVLHAYVESFGRPVNQFELKARVGRVNAWGETWQDAREISMTDPQKGAFWRNGEAFFSTRLRLPPGFYEYEFLLRQAPGGPWIKEKGGDRVHRLWVQERGTRLALRQKYVPIQRGQGTTWQARRLSVRVGAALQSAESARSSGLFIQGLKDVIYFAIENTQQHGRADAEAVLDAWLDGDQFTVEVRNASDLPLPPEIDGEFALASPNPRVPRERRGPGSRHGDAVARIKTLIGKLYLNPEVAAVLGPRVRWSWRKDNTAGDVVFRLSLPLPVVEAPRPIDAASADGVEILPLSPENVRRFESDLLAMERGRPGGWRSLSRFLEDTRAATGTPMEGKWDFSFLAVLHGRAVGYLIGLRPNVDKPYAREDLVHRGLTVDKGLVIFRAGVLESARGQGVGRRLWRAAAEKARADGVVYIYQDARVKNVRARDLYRRLGFVDIAGFTDDTKNVEYMAMVAPVEDLLAATGASRGSGFIGTLAAWSGAWFLADWIERYLSWVGGILWARPPPAGLARAKNGNGDPGTDPLGRVAMVNLMEAFFQNAPPPNPDSARGRVAAEDRDLLQMADTPEEALRALGAEPLSLPEDADLRGVRQGEPVVEPFVWTARDRSRPGAPDAAVFESEGSLDGLLKAVHWILSPNDESTKAEALNRALVGGDLVEHAGRLIQKTVAGIPALAFVEQRVAAILAEPAPGLLMTHRYDQWQRLVSLAIQLEPRPPRRADFRTAMVNLMDMGSHLREGRMATDRGLAKATRLLPFLAKSGMTDVYIHNGLYRPSEAGVVVHTQSTAEPHLLRFGNATVYVQDYIPKRMTVAVDGREVTLRDDFGNNYSVDDMNQLNPAVVDGDTNEDRWAALAAFTAAARQRGMTVTADFVPWIAPTALTFDRLSWAREAIRVEGDRAGLSDFDLLEANRDYVLMTFPEGRYLVRRYMGVDQIRPDFTDPRYFAHLEAHLRRLIDAGVARVRVDMAHDLLDPARDPQWRSWTKLIDDAKAHAARRGQSFHFIMEAYGPWAVEFLKRFPEEQVYHVDPHHNYRRVVSGQDPRALPDLLAALNYARDAQKGRFTAFPTNFDMPSLVNLGGPAESFLKLLLVYERLGVPLMIDLREMLGEEGQNIPQAGGQEIVNGNFGHPFLRVPRRGYRGLLRLVGARPRPSAIIQEWRELLRGAAAVEVLESNDPARFVTVRITNKEGWHRVEELDFAPQNGPPGADRWVRWTSGAARMAALAAPAVGLLLVGTFLPGAAWAAEAATGTGVMETVGMVALAWMGLAVIFAALVARAVGGGKRAEWVESVHVSPLPWGKIVKTFLTGAAWVHDEPSAVRFLRRAGDVLRTIGPDGLTARERRGVQFAIQDLRELFAGKRGRAVALEEFNKTLIRPARPVSPAWLELAAARDAALFAEALRGSAINFETAFQRENRELSFKLNEFLPFEGSLDVQRLDGRSSGSEFLTRLAPVLSQNDYRFPFESVFRREMSRRQEPLPSLDLQLHRLRQMALGLSTRAPRGPGVPAQLDICDWNDRETVMDTVGRLRELNARAETPVRLILAGADLSTVEYLRRRIGDDPHMAVLDRPVADRGVLDLRVLGESYKRLVDRPGWDAPLALAVSVSEGLVSTLGSSALGSALLPDDLRVALTKFFESMPLRPVDFNSQIRILSILAQNA